MRLLLVRHGQTTANVRGELDTAVPGADLTALGREQAAALPGALAGETVVGVHVSDLVRTQQTAAPLAQALGLEPGVHGGLREASAGDLEMRDDEASRDAYAATIGAWMHGDLDRAMPGGPDGHALLERYDAAIADVAAQHGPDDTVVVVSHGAAIRAWTTLRAGVEVERALRLSIQNTGGATLLGSPGGPWELLAWSTAPLGGTHLVDRGAADTTGESVAEEQSG